MTKTPTYATGHALEEVHAELKKTQKKTRELELQLLVVAQIFRVHIRCHNTGGSIIDRPAERNLAVLDKLNLRYSGDKALQTAYQKLNLEG